MNFDSEFSLWYFPLCIIIAACCSWLLYRNNPLKSDNKYVIASVYVFRFFSVLMLLVLLLGVLIKSYNRKIEKPILVLALDNSESILANQFSVYYKSKYPQKLEELISKLKINHDLKIYSFGKHLKEGKFTDFSEKQTDISGVFNELENRYSNLNLGAVILASDGIYNQNNNPFYESKKLNVPVFTIALGDSNQQRDALVKNIRHNQIVFAGNSFESQIDLSAFDCQNENLNLTIEHNGTVVFSKSISINAASFFNTIPITLLSNIEGTQHYKVKINRLKNEISYANNSFDFFVDVIKAKQKVLLLAQVPHPDLSALKNGIENNQNYSCNIKLINEFKNEDLNLFDVVILHQLPGWKSEGMNIIQQLKNKKKSLLYVLGTQTNLNQLSQLEPSLNITGNRGSYNEASALFNQNTTSFNLDENNVIQISKFPPLISPYGNYIINADADIIFKQQIGYIATNYPLIFVSKNNSGNVGFICGEGFWKWRLADFEKNKTHQISDDLLSKVLQTIALREDKSLFRVNPEKRKFNENEIIGFDAELYNESFELQNNTDVFLQITNSSGKNFNFTFSKTEKSYHLNVGILPIGNYSYKASVSRGNKLDERKGVFSIVALQDEFLETKANHQLLSSIAKESGAEMFFPENMNELVEKIKLNEKIKPIIYKQTEVKDLLNLKWLFFVLLTFLSVEWFIRKWQGFI